MIQAIKNLNLLEKKQYVIDSPIAKSKQNQNNSIKFETESIKSSPCDYSDAFILVTGDITENAGNHTYVAFKNCAPFTTCKTEINDVIIIQIHQDVYGNLKKVKFQIIMLISLLIILNHLNIKQFLQERQQMLLVESFVKDTKIVVPSKYLSNFWRSYEMPLINCKVHLELNWIENFIL